MPRRNIHENLLTSKSLDKLSDGAARLFFHLIVVADDYGRFDAEPEIMTSKCFPLRAGKLKVDTVRKWRDELAQAGMIGLYAIDGKVYGLFFSWIKWQGDPRAKKSKFPEPEASAENKGDNNCTQLHADVLVVRSSDSRINESRITNNDSSSASAEGAAAAKVQITPSRILEIYEAHRGCLPECRKFEGDRAKQAALRLREDRGFAAEFEAALKRSNQVPFLCGKGKRGWKPNLDWFLANGRNIYRVLEGVYDKLVEDEAPPPRHGVIQPPKQSIGTPEDCEYCKLCREKYGTVGCGKHFPEGVLNG